MFGRITIAVLLFARHSSTQVAPSFEVASIKPHTTTGMPGRTGVAIQGSTVSAEKLTLSGLIAYAYDFKFYEIIGGPKWIETDRYDITAKTASLSSRDEVKEMLKSLLTDRFQLKLRQETRDMPVYALIVDRGGLKCKVSPPEASSRLSVSRAGSRGVHLEVEKGTMAQLANQLSSVTDRRVVDQTRLSGDYNYNLDYNSRFEQAPSESSFPSVFSAVEEQLGLKLKPQKAPVRIVVVDRAERPSVN